MTIEEYVPLAPLTTFRLGGRARYFVRAKHVEDLAAAVAFAQAKALPLCVLGGGSNTLVTEDGFPGLVLCVDMVGMTLSSRQHVTTITVGAGESWDTLVAYACEQGLWGIENLSAIPGTVGGAVVQNIGAYGAVLSESLSLVRAYNRESGKVEEIPASECGFGYRESIFQKENSPYIVLEAVCTLTHIAKPNCTYKDLAERFGNTMPGLQEIREAVIEIRKNKFPDLAQEGTAGSFFKNPILTNAQAHALQEKFPNLPVFDLPEAVGKKVPLAWFLDERNHALVLSERQVGGARLFEKQPLVIAASFTASPRDVLLLATKIKNEIKKQLAIEISFEVKII